MEASASWKAKWNAMPSASSHLGKLKLNDALKLNGADNGIYNPLRVIYAFCVVAS